MRERGGAHGRRPMGCQVPYFFDRSTFPNLGHLRRNPLVLAGPLFWVSAKPPNRVPVLTFGPPYSESRLDGVPGSDLGRGAQSESDRAGGRRPRNAPILRTATPLGRLRTHGL